MISIDNIEKFFSGKMQWIMGFCVLFILVSLSLKVVSDARLQVEAQLIGENIFSWEWPSKNWRSRIKINKLSVVNRTNTDAIVKIKGIQTLLIAYPQSNINRELIAGRLPKKLDLDCTATLWLYKRNNHWELGCVEL